MGIKQSNINNLLFFVYNILPIQEKIKFLSEIDDDDIDESISSKLFTKYINKTDDLPAVPFPPKLSTFTNVNGNILESL